MGSTQADLFAEDVSQRNKLSDAAIAFLRANLEQRIAELEAALVFPWPDPIDAIHEEKRFRREAAQVGGSEGAALWTRFDREIDRLYDAD